MIDMETIIKNYGYIIRNPRQTKFMDRQFGKKAFLNKNKHPYKQVVNDLNMDFINSKKILVTKNISKKFNLSNGMPTKSLQEDFLPFYNNQIVMIESPNGNDEDNHVGFWIRDKKTHHVISTFFFQEGNLINTIMDWGISKTKNLWESHWAHSSTTHGSNLKLLQSWWAGKNKHLFDYYLAYTKPFQHWSLKNPADNPYIRELDFQEKEEILTPIRVHYFIQLLNNLKENKECFEIEPEERLANLRNKKPTAYQYKVLDIGNVSNSTNYVYNRSVNKNRFHDVRGFYRHYKSGKKVWIKNHTRGTKELGVIEKDYVA